MNKLIKTITILSFIVALLSFSIQFKYYTSDNTIEETKYNELSYTALGDSITEGSLVDGELIKGYSYPEVVGSILGLKNVYNMGISGSSIGVGFKPMYERYKGIPLNSDIISIAGGNNDSNTYLKEIGTIDDLTGYTFYGALNILVKGVIKKYPNAFIFLITRGPWDDIETSIGTKYSDYVNATINIGKKYRILVLDIFNNEKLYEDVKANNNSHPSKKAMENVLGPIIVDFIRDNYK